MADDVHQSMVTETRQVGFWKPRHAIIGVGALLFVILLVRACSGEPEVDEKLEAKNEQAVPASVAAGQIPAQQQWQGQRQQWQGQYPPVQQQFVPQQPVYPYPYPAPGQAPVQQTRQLPSSEPGNPWSVRPQQPANSYSAPVYPQPVEQAPQWGQPQQQRPVYSQPRGTAQYRPLDQESGQSKGNAAQPAPAPPAVPATNWRPAAPYDRPAGSSYGPGGAQQPYPGSYPGYYGGSGYGVPGYGSRLPGYPGFGTSWY